MRVQASGNSFPAYQKRGEPDRRQMADMIIMHAVEALIIMPATRESSKDRFDFFSLARACARETKKTAPMALPRH